MDQRIGPGSYWSAKRVAQLIAFVLATVAGIAVLFTPSYTTPGVTLLLLGAGLTTFVVIVSIVVVLGTTATVRTPRNPRYPTLT